MNYSVGIICTGSELLGKVREKNGFYIAQEIRKKNLYCKEMTILVDDRVIIKKAIERLSKEHQIVFIIGGLGNTGDDFSREIAIELLGNEKILLSKYFRKKMLRKYKEWGMKLPRHAASQLIFPKDCNLLPSSMGIVPGFSIKYNDSILYFLPGVPEECLEIFNDKLFMQLNSNVPSKIYSCLIYNRSEVEINNKIKSMGWFNKENFRVEIRVISNFKISVELYTPNHICLNQEWENFLGELKCI